MPSTPSDLANIVGEAFTSAVAAHRASQPTAQQVIPRIATRLQQCFDAGGKVLTCGNGGSAGDAQHLASELVNRFECDRVGLAALALTTESSTLTAIANDRGYEHVFGRQVEALARPGDVLIGFSTSGQSASVVAAARTAQRLGLTNIGFTGRDGGAFAAALGVGDIEFRAVSTATADIQAVHLTAIHSLCRLIDLRYAESG